MNTSKLEKERVQGQRVPVGEPVWVQCDGYRCLACIDQKGEWHTFFNGAKLVNVVKVFHEAAGKVRG